MADDRRKIEDGREPITEDGGKTAGFKPFEEMEVWQAACDLAVDVYRDFRGVKDYSFADQVKRAAISISNNIAEGAERTTPVEFSRFLDIAKGSAGEVRSMYFLAERLGFVDQKVVDLRCEQCRSISRQLAGFARHLRSKKIPSGG